MKIKRLEIENFRRLEKYKIDFASRSTVIIGRNGSGKTTLLVALRKALSFVFSKSEGKSELPSLCDGMPALKVEGYKRKYDLEIDQETRMAPAYIKITGDATLGAIDLPEWQMFAKTSTFKLSDSAYKEAYSVFFKEVIEPKKSFPLLAFFSDGFPHIDLHKKSMSTGITIPRNMGYYAWNDYNSCLSIWLDRFKRSWLKCNRLERHGHLTPEYHRLKHEVDIVTEALCKLTADDDTYRVVDCIVDEMNDNVSIVSADNYTTEFTKLPAGYRRILGICFDLAYRSLILNDINSLSESRGIVIIDEIDLHLHPSLEANVLQRFMATFEGLQFVVSTHSPLVISNLDASVSSGNAVYMMVEGEDTPVRVPNLYGVDYNATIRDAMLVPDRNDDIQYLVNNYKAFKVLNMVDAANETAQALKQMLNDDSPILIELGII